MSRQRTVKISEFPIAFSYEINEGSIIPIIISGVNYQISATELKSYINDGSGGSGFQGLQGFQGVNGTIGVNGAQGPQGPQGYQGRQGDSIQGPQGFTGPTGNQGQLGPQGFNGNTGLQGSQGLQGLQGLQGNVSTTGSWTVTAGSGTYSFTVPINGSYVMWVIGNIPNGIIAWNATVTVTNSNVAVIGTQYGWYYTAGNQLVLNSMPSQITGTAGSISTSEPMFILPSNTFSFNITNNSASDQTIQYGYTKI